MRPATVDLSDHTRGDTWEGMDIGPITINGVSPNDPVASCRMQFRDSKTGSLGYELNSSPGVGEGSIVIDDADTWEFTVPPQILIMSAGRYVWDFEATDTAGVIRTFYNGSFRLVADVTRD